VSKQNANEMAIAFLGVGQMGTPMASRLISAGFNVRVWNRSKERVKELVQRGAIEASTPAEATASADVVITMLPDGPTIEAVFGGAEGAFATLASGAVWLQMGTIGIDWTERLRKTATEARILFVDAPVSGSVSPASAGQLIILASGPDEAQSIAEPIFGVLGSHTFWLGAAGAGSRAKLVLNNWLVDLVEMVVETLKFSEALGLDPRVIVEIISDAPIGSPYAVTKARGMLDGDYSPNFALKLAVKDTLLALDAARSVGEELPITANLIAAWQRAVSDGAGDLDLSVVYRYARA
jgi:3-hydroxyisobutyrate dehydrogenase